MWQRPSFPQTPKSVFFYSSTKQHEKCNKLKLPSKIQRETLLIHIQCFDIWLIYWMNSFTVSYGTVIFRLKGLNTNQQSALIIWYLWMKFTFTARTDVFSLSTQPQKALSSYWFRCLGHMQCVPNELWQHVYHTTPHSALHPRCLQNQQTALPSPPTLLNQNRPRSADSPTAR